MVASPLEMTAHLERPDHPTVTTDVNNLGGVLQALGDLQEARKSLERALKIFREKLGEDHPDAPFR